MTWPIMHYSISSHTFYFGNASRAYANWLAATRKCVFKLSSEIFHLFGVCLPPVKLLPIVFRLNNPKWQFSSVRQVGSRTNSSLRTGWDTAGKCGWLLRLKKKIIWFVVSSIHPESENIRGHSAQPPIEGNKVKLQLEVTLPFLWAHRV